MAKVFIGLPVYNGERYLAATLKSLVNQSFSDWAMLIADNRSTDQTRAIADSFAAQDHRIQVFSHSDNLGPTGNFAFVLEKADTPYFMWASHDDLWDPLFIESAVEKMETHPQVAMAFCNPQSIDSFGRIIENYPDFQRFSQIGDRTAAVLEFISEEEILGKANLIYSVYRTEACRRAWAMSEPLHDRQRGFWGADNAFVMAALSICEVMVDERCLFKKRIPRPSDSPDIEPSCLLAETREDSVLPLEIAGTYIEELLYILRDHPAKEAARSVMHLRTEIACRHKKNRELMAQNLELSAKLERLRATAVFRLYRTLNNFFRFHP